MSLANLISRCGDFYFSILENDYCINLSEKCPKLSGFLMFGNFFLLINILLFDGDKLFSKSSLYTLRFTLGLLFKFYMK